MYLHSAKKPSISSISAGNPSQKAGRLSECRGRSPGVDSRQLGSGWRERKTEEEYFSGLERGEDMLVCSPRRFDLQEE
jgi:hypothetical protein